MRWLTLFAAVAMATVTSCSTPTVVSVPGEPVPPHLENDSMLSSGEVVVVNPNVNHALHVDFIRVIPGYSTVNRTTVPPGGSVAIGPNSMNGERCSYQISGWDTLHSSQHSTHVAKAKAREKQKQDRVVAQADTH